MSIIDFISPDKGYKDSVKKATGISKIRKNSEPRLYVTLGTKDRGGRGLGRFHEVIEAFVDSDNRLFVGYRIRDGSGLFRQYTVVGRVLASEDEEEAV